VPRYSASVRVRFAEIDRAGIVYYPRFFHYFHIAFEEFFADRVGVPYHVMIDEKRIGFPTVHVECDYREPLEFGDVLDVGVSVARMGDSSVDFRYRLRRGRSAKVAAEALVTVVCVDMDTFRPMRVPAFCRKVFLRYAEDRSKAPRAPRRRGRRRR
jgi:4-hydroxybenzoyl-CoA thioesterase